MSSHIIKYLSSREGANTVSFDIKKIYTENPYVDEMVYYTKLLAAGTVLKMQEVADNSENDVNLAKPWVNIVIPTNTRKINKPKLKNFWLGAIIDEITFFITTF